MSARSDSGKRHASPSGRAKRTKRFRIGCSGCGIARTSNIGWRKDRIGTPLNKTTPLKGMEGLKLALTAGEPAGIGPDLCVQMAQLDLPYNLVVIADRHLLW